MKHASKLIGIAATGLVISSGAFAAEPDATNLGPAVVGASQSTIFGETEEEQRRNRALTIAGVAGALILGAVLLDDDDDEVDDIETPIHVPTHHG